MQVKAIRRELRLLRYYAFAMTVVAGAFLLGAVDEARQNASFDRLTVHRIDVMDREGKLAMVITSHDDFPPPIINGKAMHRNGGADSNGIIFYNQRGDEQGALDWSGRIASDGSYTSANTLSYDSVTTDQMLQVDNGNENGKTYAFMIGWNRPNMHTPQFEQLMDELQSATTPSARQAVLARYPDLVGANVTRYLFGYDQTNTAQVMLADGKGKPRIKMFVTPDGQAALQFLDANGAVVAQYPQAKP
jgi:hypothetical protein